MASFCPYQNYPFLLAKIGILKQQQQQQKKRASKKKNWLIDKNPLSKTKKYIVL